MKILIIPQYGRTGGALTWLLNVLDIHRAHGIETALLIERRMAWPEVLEQFSARGARVYSHADTTKKQTNSLFCAFYDLWHYLPTFLRFRPDLVLVSNCAPLQQNGVFLLPGSVVFLMHTCPNSPHSRRHMLVPQKMLSAKKRFATVSHYAARCIQQNVGVPLENIEVIYNPAHDPGFVATLESPVVLSASHVYDYRNPDVWYATAQAVIRRCPEAHFVWIGDGDCREELLARAKRDGMENKILLPGFSTTPLEWYARSAVYFQPTFVENHSIAVIDAMASGIPCVVSNVGGLPESVVDGESGYLCAPQDTNAFVDRIVCLLSDFSLRRKMGSAGRTRAAECFSPALQEKRVLEFYQRLIHKRTG